jgi:hypothetical protein
MDILEHVSALPLADAVAARVGRPFVLPLWVRDAGFRLG